MRIDVAFLPEEIRNRNLAQTDCVVLDIFRATTSMVTAMAQGCPFLCPVQTIEEARETAARIPGALLAGERKSVRIEGFDLGNSPLEFSRERLAGRPVVMTTTNGTRAVQAAAKAEEVLIGSFLNAGTLVTRLLGAGRDVLILCAGTEGEFSLEDSLCAGLLVERLAGGAGIKANLTDAAMGTRLIYRQVQNQLAAVAADSRNGRRLRELNLKDDVEYCFRVDTVPVLPRLREGKICL